MQHIESRYPNQNNAHTRQKNKVTMGELISALQDVTNNDTMVPTLFSDLKDRGLIKVDEAAVMQAWMEAPEALRKI
jgi:hypothetical protein